MSLIKGNHGGLGGSGAPGGALGSFFSHTIDNSARFSDAGNTNLIFTPGTPSSTSVWTMSVWMKKYNPNASQPTNEFFSAGGGSAYTFFAFNASQYFAAATEQSGTKNKLWYNRTYRDPAAWFHLVLRSDLGQSTQTDRLRLYINGELQTHTSDGIPMSSWSYVNESGVPQNWGGKSGSANGNPGCDFYLADINFTDGQSYEPTEFGETKDGVWIPKNPSVTYGNNGYRLEVKQTGTGGASSSTIGADTSVNDNHFTDSGFAAHDVVPDSPTNNFATMNPLMIGDARVHSSAVYSEGNLKVACGGFSTSTIGGGYSTIAIPKDKKIYCEIVEPNRDANLWGAGVIIDNHVQASNQIAGNGAIAYYNRSVYLNGTENDYGSGGGALGGLGVSKLAAGDVLGIAVDGATGKVWFHRNGTYFGEPQGHQSGAGTTGNPSAGTNEIGTINNTNSINPSGEIFIFLTGNNTVDDLFINFGQDSTFGGNKSAGSETDANGEGLFQYAVPTDYVCLHSGNMSDPTIGPGQSEQADDNFETVLYAGTGSTQSTTGIFQPAFTWIKARDGAGSGRQHMLFDAVRGATKNLRSHLTNAETTVSTSLTSFNSDGFTIGSDSDVNTNGENFVAWNWKAGTAFSNDASATGVGSLDSAGFVNQAAGFAVIGYTGTIQSGETVAHGLGGTPEMIWAKNRDSSANWVVFTKDLTADRTLYLNLTNGENNSGTTWGNHTSTVFGVDDDPQSNGDGDATIAYLFRSIEGYSKVGKYTGNGSTDGTFVYTGFRPAWIMVKEIGASGYWMIQDNKIYPFNDGDTRSLAPNDTGTESTISNRGNEMDILSNGFKMRASTGDFNASGSAHIYLAFAEAPFKFANAR